VNGGGAADEWFVETLYPEFHQSLRIDEVLFHGRTAFQEALIFRNERFGRVLTLDGIVQTTENDEFCYHEMIAHVPIIAHGAVRRVLIIGGGDGGVLRETLKHPGVTATMIELDKTVVNICRQYMPSLSAGAFDDPRADVRFMDGIKFVAETDEKFDVIIVDSTDPIGPGDVLFTQEFYVDCARCLTEKGMLITQSGVTFMQNDEARNTWQRMKSLFVDPAFYVTQVPSYAAGLMTLGWGCHSIEPRQTSVAELTERVSRAGLSTKYYTPATHHAAFSVPAYIEALKSD
jgi:spermidine synthase